jgi:hypothetical protein
MLLEPEYGTERAQEGDAFDSGKCNHLFSETDIDGITPFEGPVGFVLEYGPVSMV